MKKPEIKKILAALTAVMLSAAMLTACKNNNPPEETTAASSETVPQDTDTEPEITTRALEEGDVYAINKFAVSIPDGYQLMVSTESQQGIIYVNKEKKSQITVRSINYKDDAKLLSEFADSACATIKMNNMLVQADTVFSTPYNMKIGGFDAVVYDYNTTENTYDASDTKTPVAWYTSRAYYFYSDKDVFWIIAESPKDYWDNAVKDVESFISSIKIDENAKAGTVKEVNGAAPSAQ